MLSVPGIASSANKIINVGGKILHFELSKFGLEQLLKSLLHFAYFIFNSPKTRMTNVMTNDA